VLLIKRPRKSSGIHRQERLPSGRYLKGNFAACPRGEYKVEDIILLAKIMVTLGAEFSPLAGILPAKLLLEMMTILWRKK
jgi:hypothetical protein